MGDGLENPAKMSGIGKTTFDTHLGDIEVGIFQKEPTVRNTLLIEVLGKRNTQYTLKLATEIRITHI